MDFPSLDEYRAKGILTSRITMQAAMARVYVEQALEQAVKDYRAAPTSHDPLDNEWSRLHNEGAPDSYFRRLHLIPEAIDYVLANKEALMLVASEGDCLHALMRSFERNVWLGSLKKYWRDTDERGHSGKGKKFEALLWGSAGRALVTLRESQNGPWISLIFDDSESTTYCRGGVQGCEGTYAQLRALLVAATEGFPKMKPSRDVTLFGF